MPLPVANDSVIESKTRSTTHAASAIAILVPKATWRAMSRLVIEGPAKAG